MGPERVIERIKSLVQGKKLQGISDVKDLTDREKGLQLVIEVKNGFVPEAILEQLYAIGERDLAAAAANALAQGFTDSQLDTSEKSSQTTTAWMNTRLIKLRDNLRAAEKKLQGYREEQGLVDVGGVATISA